MRTAALWGQVPLLLEEADGISCLHGGLEGARRVGAIYLRNLGTGGELTLRGFGQVGSGRHAVGVRQLVFHANHTCSLEANSGNDGKNQEKQKEDDKCANEAVIGNSGDTDLTQKYESRNGSRDPPPQLCAWL